MLNIKMKLIWVLSLSNDNKRSFLTLSERGTLQTKLVVLSLYPSILIHITLVTVSDEK